LQQCSSCGTFDADWRDPRTHRVLDEPRWMPVHHRCVGCQVLADECESVPEGEKGVHVGLVPWRDPELIEIEEELAALHPADDDDE
jgi:hypothetical protein